MSNLPQPVPSATPLSGSPLLASLLKRGYGNHNQVPHDWASRSPELAAWAYRNLVNRTDVWGGYRPKALRTDGRKALTKPPREQRGQISLTSVQLERHFAGASESDILGLHTTSPENTSRWGTIELDNHGNRDKSAATLNAAIAWQNRLTGDGIASLLTDSDGAGGYHLLIVFSAPVPTDKLFNFLKQLVADHAAYGLTDMPETFPKQREIGPGKCGNWLRLPGRHHTRDHWSKVWNGIDWLEGNAAIDQILCLQINTPLRLPDIPATNSVRCSAAQIRRITQLPLEEISKRIVAYIDKVPNKMGGSGRSDEAYKIAAFIQRDMAQPDHEALRYLLAWDLKNIPPLGAEKLNEIIANASMYGQRAIGEGLGSRAESDTDPHRLARSYLDRCHSHADGRTLVYWRGDFYMWTGTHYVLLSADDIGAKLNNACKQELDLCFDGKSSQSDQLHVKHVTKTLVGNVLEAVKSMVILPQSVEPPAGLLEDGPMPAPNYFSLKNGIVSIDSILSGAKDILEPHTPKFFALGTAPYCYDPVATCPQWLMFLERMLPDAQVRQLLQEWIGYNLIYDTKMQTFVLFVGDGANGKSVVLTVLICLLGAENVSAVGLEAFCGERTFALAQTLGKRANIISELGEITKTNEGILKSFVSGERRTFELKYRDAFEATPSARLTIATNILPRFHDRSDGLWRRMKYIPFNVQILDENQQNKNYIDPQWWADSGELSGIFNWAIEGLRRVKKNMQFTDPVVCKREKEKYKRESNLAAAFLLDNYEECQGSSIPTQVLYNAYTAYMTGTNGIALGKPAFGREVSRHFKNVILSENAHWICNKRDRLWHGLRVIPRHT